MLPISDSTPRRTFPFINYLIIALNVYFFYLELTAPDMEAFISQYAFIPSKFSLFSLNSYFYIITSMFMHGGFMHILSNMWFLHIFGDNVEDALGHIPYLLFYLAGGVIATLSQYAIAPHLDVPMIGASGAVSAAAGLYFVLFRKSTVKTLVVLFFGLIQIVKIPVWLFLGYWFVIQLFSGIGSFSTVGNDVGGVAYMAHIGGFVFGYFVAQFVHYQPPASPDDII